MIILGILLIFGTFQCILCTYPETSLQCYSYFTKPGLRLICPEARANYCVKEVSTLTQNLCGATQYFGDMYVNKECVLKKCSAECTEGTFSFSYEGSKYSRERFCCTSDFCNSASKLYRVDWRLFALLMTVVYLVFTWF